MCETCTENGGFSQCPTCRALSPGFAFDERADFNQLATHAINSFKREWQACVLAAAFFMVCVVIGLSVTTVFSIGVSAAFLSRVDGGRSLLLYQAVELARSVLMVPFSSLASVGLMRVMLDVARGERPTLARGLSDLPLLPGAMLLQLPVTVVVAIPGLLVSALSMVAPRATPFVSTAWGCALIPVFVLFLMSWWLFSLPELLLTGCSVPEAMRRAYSLGTQWRNLRISGYAAVAGVVIGVTLLFCGVGAVVGLPLGWLLLISLFLSLRPSSGIARE